MDSAICHGFPSQPFSHRFRCLQHISSLRSSGLWLPEGDFSHDSSPTLFGVSLLCPIRSLFRIVGSSSDMDGYLLIAILLFFSFRYGAVTTLQATSCRTGLWGVMEQKTLLRDFRDVFQGCSLGFLRGLNSPRAMESGRLNA